ncbi:hypothetical protein HC752_09215 [Vibrio sp. S9_S30]|uniref:hypothetical protein n=1 Tax=Vibrio sp. S9_S30 TaxID=2720226 RepID=UPI0016811C0F|nr:hypothetical protein [Vibrio sp. S9_S30]MBD1557118.1 hypothetical protein [Vibrio sp. S9_S30]
MTKLIVLLSVITALSGCVAVKTLVNPYKGSSMEVEVDVYQGPLSKSKEVQWQEIQVLRRSLEGLCASSFTSLTFSKSAVLKTELENYAKCASKVLQDIYSRALWPNISSNKKVTNTVDDGKKVTTYELDQTITGTSIKATKTTVEKGKGQEGNQKPNPIKITTSATEIKNAEHTALIARSLLARSELLLQQIKGEDRHLLPLSAYLAEASPSLFIEYCYQSTDPKTNNWQCDYGRKTGFAKPNMADGLLNEQYWQRINHVHSSGMGDVATAFVKDEIGNWSLKSFDSNPEALLKAYQDLSFQALSTATKLAAGNVSSISLESLDKSKRFIAYAESIAFGDSSSTSNTLSEKQVASLRQEMISTLEKVKQSYANKKSDIENRKPLDNRDELNEKLTVLKGNVEDKLEELCKTLKSASEDTRDGSGLCVPHQSRNLDKLSDMESYWKNQLEADPKLLSQGDGSRLAAWSNLTNAINAGIKLEEEKSVLEQKLNQNQTDLKQLEDEVDKAVQEKLDPYMLRLVTFQGLSYDTSPEPKP